jgi:DNA-binding HxlR family transcriptional regulator
MDYQRVLEFHGVQFESYDGSGHAIGECPFCGKMHHFYLNVNEGVWDCKRCGESGNLATFLDKIVKFWSDKTTDEDYERLGKVRGVPPIAFFKHDFGWIKHRKHWTFPTRNEKGTVVDIRVYREGGKIIGTAGLKTGLWGLQNLKSTGKVWITEGEFDGIALEWLLKKSKNKDSVLAVPGANVFKKEWVPILSDRDVILVYDADNSGDRGAERTAKLLDGVAERINFVRWGLDTNGGYDVNDLIRDNGGKKAWKTINRLIAPVGRNDPLPSSSTVASPGLNGDSRSEKNGDGKVFSFEDVEKIHSKWFCMTDESLMALKAVYAVVLSVEMSGDPLWLYIVAPPGGGKTAMLNPLRGIQDYCIFRSSITRNSLVSGWRGEGGTDPSLLPKLDGKTLVLKDMTEVLAAPSHVQDEIFSVLRGAYDGTVERSYGNAVHRNYTTHFSLLAGVTPSIHGHSKASLGERMLKFQLVPRNLQEFDDIIRAAMSNSGKEDEMEKELQEVSAGFLTSVAGSVKNGGEMTDVVPEWAIERIIALSQIVANLRGEVERDFRGEIVKYRPQNEVGTRLAKQMVKLGYCLACIGEGENKLTKKDYDIVERVAFDTAIGWNLDVVQVLMQNGGQMSRPDLARESALPVSNVTRRLDDMELLGVVRRIAVNKNSRATMPKVHYRVSSDIRKLWARAEVSEYHAGRFARARKIKKVKK